MAKLWQCFNCKKTCSTWEESKVEHMCSVCFEKLEFNRIRLQNHKNMIKPVETRKKKSKPKAKMSLEKIATLVED